MKVEGWICLVFAAAWLAMGWSAPYPIKAGYIASFSAFLAASFVIGALS